MIKVILWDIDGTLLDFEKAQRVAFFQCFDVLGLGTCTDEMLERYAKINHSYWERLERNEITKQEVLVGRYVDFFAQELALAQEGKSPLELTKDIREIAEAFNDEYQIRLGDTAVYCEGAKELVEACKGKYKQYVVTNGTAIAQYRKLKTSGLENIVDGWFISDEIGIEKPNIGFFDAVFAKIGCYEKDEVLIVGDSLTSDIQGGNNANLLTCWYNPNQGQNTKGVQVDYEIRSMKELASILIGNSGEK